MAKESALKGHFYVLQLNSHWITLTTITGISSISCIWNINRKKTFNGILESHLCLAEKKYI